MFFIYLIVAIIVFALIVSIFPNIDRFFEKTPIPKKHEILDRYKILKKENKNRKK